MIDKSSPVPLYYQLKLELRRQMEVGELRPGDQLPTELQLCEVHAISRAPVRQALTELAGEGWVYRRAGQGTFVAPQVHATTSERASVRILAHYDVRWMTSLERAVVLWNASHPESEIALDVTMCSRDEYHDVLRRSVLRGTAPDMAPMDYVWLSHYVSDGYLLPLQDIDSAWAAELAAAMERPVLRNLTFDGILYGVPIQADVAGLWYRKDWFREMGYSVPETWTEWLMLLDEFARGASRSRFGHQYSLVLPVTSMTGEAAVHLLISFFWMCGGDIVDADGRVALDSPEVREALRFLQSITLERRQYLPVDVYRSRWWDLVRFFAQGAVPMALGGSYELPRLREESEWVEEEEIAANVGFALLPRPRLDVPPVGSLGGACWVVFRQSRLRDVCGELLRMVASYELSTEFCTENLQLSPWTEVNRRYEHSQHPWLADLVPLLAHARNRSLIPSYVRVSRFVQDLVERVLWLGVDVDRAVTETARALTLVIPG